jgi:hypothetical protein
MTRIVPTNEENKVWKPAVWASGFTTRRPLPNWRQFVGSPFYLAQGGSSDSERNLVSVPLLPMTNTPRFRSMIHWWRFSISSPAGTFSIAGICAPKFHRYGCCTFITIFRFLILPAKKHSIFKTFTSYAWHFYCRAFVCTVQLKKTFEHNNNNNNSNNNNIYSTTMQFDSSMVSITNHQRTLIVCYRWYNKVNKLTKLLLRCG